MTPIETVDGVEFYYDFDPQSPREFCNLGTLAVPGGDEEPDPDFDFKDVIYSFVYKYQHSGVAYSTTPFSCPWDSGCVGYIYVPKTKVREEYGRKRISPELRARVMRVLEAEVEEFSKFANGEVYGFVNTKTGDSCWGYFDYDYCKEEALR